MPVLDHFSGKTYSKEIDRELYTKEEYYALIKDSADMNYESGWLINTGSWIADHSELYKAAYDADTKKMVVDTAATSYDVQDYTDMYAYACDWMMSRAAWLSEQWAPDYTPSPLLGDADKNNKVDIIDVTAIQRHEAKITSLAEDAMILADVDKDGYVTIVDATCIQRHLAGLSNPANGIGKPIRI